MKQLPPKRSNAIEPLGEAAWVVKTALARELAAELRARPFVGLEEAVPALATLTVFVDPLRAADAPQELARRLRSLRPQVAAGRSHSLVMTLDGPDLPWVLARLQLSQAAFAQAWQALTLEVAFLGFTPGFAFLTGLPEHFKMPRLDAPRAVVPPGSVALGGPWAGVYPLPTPGGWRLIGSTRAPLFDSQRPEPFLLSAGDTVRFEVRP